MRQTKKRGHDRCANQNRFFLSLKKSGLVATTKSPFIYEQIYFLSGKGKEFAHMLSEKAEELITGRPVDALEGLSAAIMAIPRGIVRELLKILYYIPLFLLVLILSFIPPINTAAPILWFVLGAWMMSLQFLDYPMDNHQLAFADVKEAASSRRMTSMGFGGAVALCASIPVLNFFVIPSAVVGATLLWCEELQG